MDITRERVYQVLPASNIPGTTLTTHQACLERQAQYALYVASSSLTKHPNRHETNSTWLWGAQRQEMPRTESTRESSPPVTGFLYKPIPPHSSIHLPSYPLVSFWTLRSVVWDSRHMHYRRPSPLHSRDFIATGYLLRLSMVLSETSL